MGAHARDSAPRKPRMPWRATSASPAASPSTGTTAGAAAPATASRRRRRRGALLGGVAGAATLAVVAVTVPAAMAGQQAGPQDPPPQRVGAAPHLPHGAVATAAPAGGTPLDLAVVLAPRDRAALKSFVAQVSTPGSPMYRHYLKSGQFAKSFGPSAATVSRVRAALKAKGLTAGPLEADGVTLPVHTTVSAAAKALDTRFTGYRDRDGHIGVTNTRAPALSADVAPAVTAVTGLTTTATTVHPQHTIAVGATARGGAPATAGTHVAPHIAPHVNGTTPSMCSGAKAKLFGTDTQDYWSPLALASAYGMADEPNVGTGVSIGVFEMENYAPQDIAAYQACLGTHVSVGTVKVDGGPKLAPSLSANIGVESALDIEDLIGLVPQASLLVYQGPDASDGQGGPGVATYQNFLNAYDKMVTDDRVQVISSSWGGCEQDTPPAYLDAENDIFVRAAAQGQTVTAASGDDGSGDCHRDGGANASALAVDDPASQPYVLGVGGTRMTGAGGTTQTVWNSGTGQQQGATGGGVSTYWAMDAAGYQAGVSGPGFANLCDAPAGMKCRQVPDVAAVGDPDTGYPVAVAGQWIPIGGTSGASPTWAALIAQADLDPACAAGGPVGFVNPALYTLPAGDFRDITSGTNYIAGTGVTPAGSYSAASGYDLTTGLGTPHARSIIPALCKAVPQAPATTFTPLAPTRLLDTRYKTGVSTTTPVRANSAVSLQITGRAGIPDGASAVVLNTTAVSPTATGHLIAYPDGTTRPGSSNLNWLAGQIVPNLVTVPVGADGRVELYNASPGTVHFVADVFGYYSTSTTGATYHPAGPARVLDTRSHIGVGTTTPVAADSEVSLTVAGAGGVPATGASAVVLNVTATAATATGHLIAYPSGTTRPASSNINWVKGQTVPNLVVLPVGADGKVDLYNSSSGTVHFVADVFGYFAADGSGATFHAAGPTRMLDTRYGVGAPAAGPLTSTGRLSLSLDDGNVLAGAKAVVLNVTVADSTSGGVLTVWPDGQPLPASSNLNWTKGQIVANLVTVPVVDGKVDFHVNAGSTDVIADLFGYYTG